MGSSSQAFNVSTHSEAFNVPTHGKLFVVFDEIILDSEDKLRRQRSEAWDVSVAVETVLLRIQRCAMITLQTHVDMFPYVLCMLTSVL